MTIFMNPGDCKSAETPVIPTSKVEEAVLSKNKDTDDDEDTDDTARVRATELHQILLH